MISTYDAIAKHDDMQRMASVNRETVPDFNAFYVEILREAEMHRAIALKRIFKSAWATLRKVLSHHTVPTGLAGKGAVG